MDKILTPTVKLVGNGLQTLNIGIPVEETTAKSLDELRKLGIPMLPRNWFKVKNYPGEEEYIEDSEEASCHNIREKLDSVIKTVKPMLETSSKIFKNSCSKSADRGVYNQTLVENEIKYYTPQKSFQNNLIDNKENCENRIKIRNKMEKNDKINSKNKCGKYRCQTS